MAKYSYQAKDESGRIVNGNAEASDENQVSSLLKDKHLVPIKIELFNNALSFQGTFERFQGVSIGDKASFTRQLATMIAAGLLVFGEDIDDPVDGLGGRISV